MVRRCYYKPNRSERRNFTESDAARVLCYAFRDGATIEGFFSKAEECGGGVIADFITKELEKRIKPELCKATSKIDITIRTKLSRVVAVINLLASFADALDGLVSDIESANVAGVRIVPRFLTVPLRRIVDRIEEAVQDIQNAVDGLFNELDIFKGYCDGSEN